MAMQWLDELRWRSAGWGPLYFREMQRAEGFDVTEVRRYLDPYVRPQAPLFSTIDFRKDLPNCAPLAPAMYMEWHEPFQPAGRLGVLMPAWLPHEGDPPGWQVGIFLIGRTEHNDGFAYSKACLLAHVDPDGTVGALGLFNINEARDALDLLPLEDLTDEEDGRSLQALYCCSYVGLTAICFAHCRGVTLTEHEPPRQQRRAAARAGRPPLVTYKTLDIAPVTRILRDQGQIEKSGIKRALHLCRGHFARYSGEKPLFGRYTGTFYRPMHMRGRPEQGAVVKDYRVLSPPSPEGTRP